MTTDSANDAQHFPSGHAEDISLLVVGTDALHHMTATLLAEAAPVNARVLVLGAGGGLELKALATAQPQWTFVGIDPAAQMLERAAINLGPLKRRVELVQGYIDDAPPGPFDAAICLLSLHFVLDATERLRTAQRIHQCLKSGAPFVAVRGSDSQDAIFRRKAWLSRYAAHAISTGGDTERVENARKAIEADTHRLQSPEQDEAILREAGFVDVALFSAALTWRGWICRA